MNGKYLRVGENNTKIIKNVQREFKEETNITDVFFLL